MVITRSPNHQEITCLEKLKKVLRAEKKESGYHKRSLAKTTMYRFKTIFGSSLKSRSFENQACEAILKCFALNKMTKLRMPENINVN